VNGDEVLLLTPIGTREDVALDLDWILRRFKEPFFVEGFRIFASASIGVSLYPEDGLTYEQLRTSADRAMHESKAKGKGTVRFFGPPIEQAAAECNRLEQRERLMIRDRRVCCAQGFCFSRRLFLNSFEAPSTHRHEARLLNPTRGISAGRLPQGIAR